jgi:hypothetical protein
MMMMTSGPPLLGGGFTRAMSGLVSKYQQRRIMAMLITNWIILDVSSQQTGSNYYFEHY